MTSRLRAPNMAVAVVGYGLGGATFHAPLIHATPGMRVAAIVTRDPNRRAAAARDYPSAAIVERVADLWSLDTRIDLVAISTPSGTHARLAMEVLEAGAHVVVDKPFAATVAEARDIQALAARQGRLAIPFQNRRWDGDFLTVRTLLDRGAFGAVHRFESRFDRWREAPKARWCAAGASGNAEGIIYDIGSHLIDQALVLFGAVTSVWAEADRRHAALQVEDDAFIALTHASGVRSHLYMTSAAAQPSLRMGVWGSSASYIKYGLDGQEAALLAGARPGSPGWGVESPDTWGRLGVGSHVVPVHTEAGAYERFYAGVADAVLDAGTPPVLVWEAIEALTVLEAARRSAKEGVPVLLTTGARVASAAC